jgi:hypothetical protein
MRPPGFKVQKPKRTIRKVIREVNARFTETLEQRIKWACRQGKKVRVKKVRMLHIESGASPILNIRKSLDLYGQNKLKRAYLVFTKFRGLRANEWAGLVTQAAQPPGLPRLSPVAAANHPDWTWMTVFRELAIAMGADYDSGRINHNTTQHWYDPTFDPDNDTLRCWYRANGVEWCNVAFSPFLTRLDNQPCEWYRPEPFPGVFGQPQCVEEFPEPDPTPTPEETP